MPTVNLSKKTVEQLMGTKLSTEELKNRISMLGTDLDSIEGDEIQVEIFPNRPDMLSEQGFARALSSFIGKKTGLAEFKVNKSDYEVIVEKPVEKVRPYTVCAVIKNLKFTDEKLREIIQIQEKLHIGMGRNRKKLAIGIYPMEHIKFPITYTAKKPRDIKFLPLEAKKEMDGLQILSQHPTGRDYGHLLQGAEVFPIFIDANKEIMSMPPIINSEKTGKVKENTKDVFIECSGFDLRVLNQCLNIIVTALSDMGGEIYEVKVKYSKPIITPKLKAREWDLNLEYVNKIIGVEFTKKEVKKLLERMGYGYENDKVLVPSYRTDILHQIDIAEDIAIAYGYDNFKPEIPNVATIGEEHPIEILKKKIANILLGLGQVETISYHLINKEDHNQKMNYDTKVVELANSSTKEYSIMRKSVLPSLMQILSRNTNKEYPQEIFEIGTIFKLNNKKETSIEENTNLGVGLCGPVMDFTKIKQVLDSIMKALDLKYTSKEITHQSFIEGRCAKIKVKDQEIAIIGELHPKVITNFGIEMPIAAMELNLTKIEELKKE
jgi:phenylalanyl-tRNA synthetase beta chain